MAQYTNLIAAWNGATQPPTGVTGSPLLGGDTTAQKLAKVQVNRLDVPVLAVDVPSGLDATTGLPLGAAIKATATATFGFLKIGCLIERGPELAGQVEVIDIGIPPGLVQSAGIERYWLTGRLLSSWIEPRHPTTHKGQAGHVCVYRAPQGKPGLPPSCAWGPQERGRAL